MLRPVSSQIRRMLDAYPAIYVACHLRHVHDDEHGKKITEQQARVLHHLDIHSPTTVSRVAEHMGVSRSTMSIAATRLERAGYIARYRNLHDKRSVGLVLTPAGVRIKEQNTVLDPKLLRELFRLTPPDELERALQGLERLATSARLILKRRKRKHDR